MHTNALFATDPAEELTLLSQTPVARLIGGKGKGREGRGKAWSAAQGQLCKNGSTEQDPVWVEDCWTQGTMN